MAGIEIIDPQNITSRKHDVINFNAVICSAETHAFERRRNSMSPLNYGGSCNRAAGYPPPTFTAITSELNTLSTGWKCSLLING